jgi:multiple sugar transport system ATP-binding protein
MPTSEDRTVANVSIRQLTKRFDAEDVVRGIDLEIDDGEFLVVVGPSGCGKTSVLRMVAGLEEITSGSVLIDGVQVAQVPRESLTLGMVFQDPTLYPFMTVEQNIGFPLRMAGEPRRTVRREVAATAEMLGLTPMLRRLPSKLSGGQRQRVAMARALIRRPALLLMDEPMSNLDAKLRTELRATIARLRHELGVTTLYVTHDQIEAMALGDRIAVMRHGEIVQLGTPDQVYRRPVDAFVATFIGSPAMNLFAATITSDQGEPALGIGSAVLPLGRGHRESLAGCAGENVIAGIRPQSFRFTGDGAVVDVERMQLLAHRFEISATLDAAEARVTDRGVEIGSRPSHLTIDLPVDEELDWELWRPSHLVVDPADIHLFDPVTGVSLPRQPSPAALG